MSHVLENIIVAVYQLFPFNFAIVRHQPIINGISLINIGTLPYYRSLTLFQAGSTLILQAFLCHNFAETNLIRLDDNDG